MDKALLSRAGIDHVVQMLTKKGFAVTPLPRNAGAHLLVSKGDKLCKVTVRTKQKIEWPAVKASSGKNHFIVLVDFENRSVPDFYILNNQDYMAAADIRVRQVVHRAGRSTYPVERDKAGTPTWVTETVKATGENYEGCSLRPEHIRGSKDKWEKIIAG